MHTFETRHARIALGPTGAKALPARKLARLLKLTGWGRIVNDREGKTLVHRHSLDRMIVEENLMSTTTSELNQFYQFIGERLRAGETNLTPEEALDIWREDNVGTDEINPEDVRAIEEAIEDMRNGDAGIPIEEFDREF